MANSRDYDTLLRAWKGWRDGTGKKIRTQYTEYVQLNNEGVREAPGGMHFVKSFDPNTLPKQLLVKIIMLKCLFLL